MSFYVIIKSVCWHAQRCAHSRCKHVCMCVCVFDMLMHSFFTITDAVVQSFECGISRLFRIFSKNTTHLFTSTTRQRCYTVSAQQPVLWLISVLKALINVLQFTLCSTQGRDPFLSSPAPSAPWLLLEL